MADMFYTGWQPLLRIVVVGILAYASLVVMLRVTGKRTLSKLNAFDLVITVSLGSCLATVLLSKDISLTEGIVAFATLCGLQYCVTWLSIRWTWVERIVKSEPTLLLLRGKPLEQALRRERLTLDELQSAVRSAQGSDLQSVDAIVLETDGSLSVIKKGGVFSMAELPGVSRRDQAEV
jgi:uncharacterized membrane protein YcaP (DUF421 family)